MKPLKTQKEVMELFEEWWHNEGSSMPPKPGEDAEIYVKRISAIAWSNGAYCVGGSKMSKLQFIAIKGEFATLAQPRIGSNVPSAYRLIHRKYEGGESEYVLQGLFTWTEGFGERGAEWRDLPTQEEDSQNTPKDDIPFAWAKQ